MRRAHRWIPVALIGILLACMVLVIRDLMHYAAAREEYASMDAALIREAIPTWETIPEDAGVNGYERDAGGDDNDVDVADPDSVPTELASASEEDMAADAADMNPPILQIDYAGYAAINADFAGVLYCPQLGIRYPVAHSQDNQEYLARTFEGNANSAGCIFMDCQNQRDWSDRNTYVYGHNMKDGSMFGSLQELVQDENPQRAFVYIYTPTQTLRYQIFCAEIATPDAGLGNIYRDSQYDIYVEEIRRRSWYWDEGIDLSARPNLLTLYTCYGDGHTRKLLVHAAAM